MVSPGVASLPGPPGAEEAQFRSQELPGQSLTWAPSPLPAPPPTAGSEAEGFLGGVDHVEEAILILLLLIDVRDGRGHAHHAVLVHQQEEGLRGVQLQAAPDYLDQLAHVDVVRDQELGLVQDWQLLLTLVALYDHRDLAGVLVADLLHLLTAVGEAPPLLERPVRGHLAGPAGRAGRDSGAGRWLRYRGAGAPHLARKGSGAHAEPSVGGSGR